MGIVKVKYDFIGLDSSNSDIIVLDMDNSRDIIKLSCRIQEDMQDKQAGMTVRVSVIDDSTENSEVKLKELASRILDDFIDNSLYRIDNKRKGGGVVNFHIDGRSDSDLSVHMENMGMRSCGGGCLEIRHN